MGSLPASDTEAIQHVLDAFERAHEVPGISERLTRFFERCHASLARGYELDRPPLEHKAELYVLHGRD